MREQERQVFCSSIRKFGPIGLAYFTMLIACGLPAHGQQPSQSDPVPASVQPSQDTHPLGAIQSALAVAPKPTPDGKTQRPTAQPGMTGMESSGVSSQEVGMGNDMMGAAGLTPPGIMIGQAKKWMVGYQVMFDNMNGNLIGSDRISDATVLEQFEATPTDMTMQMHMGMVMYAPTDKLTLMAMLPYIRKSMNHITRDGTRFTERTSGIGDLELRGLYSLYAQKDLRHRFLLNAGIGVPTGSINRTMEDMRLEYPMQLGSGTYSLLPGITYLGQTAHWGWGAEFIPTLRLGRNSNGYRLGNRYQSSIWVARELTRSVTLSARANGEVWRNIRGVDAALDQMDEPTKDPTLQGGKRLDLLLRITFHPVEGIFKGQQFFAEAGAPVVQSLDGPQLQRRWVARLGSQWEF